VGFHPCAQPARPQIHQRDVAGAVANRRLAPVRRGAQAPYQPDHSRAHAQIYRRRGTPRINERHVALTVGRHDAVGKPLGVHGAVGAAAARFKLAHRRAHKRVPQVNDPVAAGGLAARAQVAHREDGLAMTGVDPLGGAHVIAFADVAQRPQADGAILAAGEEAVLVVEGGERAHAALVAGPALQADLLEGEGVGVATTQLVLPVGQPVPLQMPVTESIYNFQFPQKFAKKGKK